MISWLLRMGFIRAYGTYKQDKLANLRLREKLDAGAARLGARVHYPPLALCTDNGAMIALAAALRLQHGMAALQTDGAFDVRPHWPLAEVS